VDELFLKVAQRLNNLGIPYMLSGSIAMGFYTIPRMTRDIDIVVEMQENDVAAFLKNFGDFYFHEPSILEEVKRRGMFNLIDFQTNYKVDFIIRKLSEYALTAFSRRNKINQNDNYFWLIAIEDLIIAKLIWIQDVFSERQANDVSNLLRNPDIDYTYLHEWCSKLDLQTYNLL